MGADPDSGEVEWLDLGPAAATGSDHRPGRQWHWWYAMIAVGVIALLVIGGVVRQGGTKSAAPATHSATPSPTPSRSSVSAPSVTPTPPVAVTDLGHPLLDVPADWELFGLSSDGVVRIQLATGRITRTTAPPLDENGQVSFIVTSVGALVRTFDTASGYLVPDGRPARALPGALAQALAVFPGPDPAHLWVESGSRERSSVELVDLGGTRIRASGPLPANSYGSLTSDGAGGLLFSDFGGAYALGPAGLQRITPGLMLGTGRTKWLVAECDDQHHCAVLVIDRASGARRVLGPAGIGTDSLPNGSISPDGSTAALLRYSQDGTPTFALLDLTSGRQTSVPTPLHSDATFVWSPDSRWLFAVGALGQVNVIDPHTGRARELGVSLPQLTHLTIRSTS